MQITIASQTCQLPEGCLVRDALVAAAVLLVNLVLYNAAILTIGAFCLITHPGIYWHYEPACRVLIVLGILEIIASGVLTWFTVMTIWSGAEYIIKNKQVFS